MGKTRLSIAAAENSLGKFSSGVWFVDLAPVTDASRVAEAAAQALQIGEEPKRSPEERLTDMLASSCLLVVLDNCEHVLDAAALSSLLLSHCPEMRILATSRQALGIPGEQVIQVPSLAAPPKDASAYGPNVDIAHAEKNVQALLEYAAVRLFVGRARQASPSFRLTRRNADAVADLCRRLDGIPLALELAAARVRSLTPQEIVSRLDERFRLLAGGNRAAAPRHQTLRAAIDWSYDLLEDAERSVLRSLSVFTGGWSLDAAEQVYEPVGDAGDVTLLLSSLVDKCLVSAHREIDEEGGTRYAMLETVRQYARERSQEGGEETSASRRYTEWALALAEHAEGHLTGPDSALWLNRLEIEHDNFRRALNWLAKQPDAAHEHLRLAAALSHFWIARGHYHTGRQLLQEAFAHADADDDTDAEWRGFPQDCELRAKATRGAAIFASSQGDYPAARAFFEEALALRRRIGDAAGIANAINNLGTVTWLQSDLPAAQALYQESLGLYRQLGEARGKALALYNIALLAYDSAVEDDDFRPIRPVLEEAAACFAELEDDRNRSYALNALGNVLIEIQDYAAAQAVHEQNLELASAVGDPLLIADAQGMLAVALGSQGEFSAAYPLLREALRHRLEMGDKRNACIALRAAASLFAAHGRSLQAATLWGALEAIREHEPVLSLNVRQQAEYGRSIACARSVADPTQFAAAWQRGQGLTWQQAIDHARCDMS